MAVVASPSAAPPPAARRPFVARFDSRACYESIDHDLPRGRLRDAGVTGPLLGLPGQHVALPGRRGAGRGLHEARESRLRRYVQRWYAWLRGGLSGLVAAKGGCTRIWVTVLRHLHITGYRVRPA
jgi:hypothetical protein